MQPIFNPLARHIAMKKILIINGHPDKESLCHALTDAYQKGAQSNSQQEVRRLDLIDLQFDPILRFGYRVPYELEPDLLKAQQDILWADHLVWVYPIWWGTFPALLKGFIDRIFLPGFAFKYHKEDPFWDKLLKGRTARVITTMDTPSFYYRLMYAYAGHKIMNRQVLGFSGVKAAFTTFAPIRNSRPEQRAKWLEQVGLLGKEGK
jgi:putative NADPH-quinone reductase